MTRGRATEELGHPLDRVRRDPETGCWLWQGKMQPTGYGKFGKLYAHRIYWELFNEATIPDGMHVDHLCRVRQCVNPEHLEVVTPKENILRGVGAAAQNARKTHCAYGHELSGDNLRVFKLKRGSETRMCVTCNREKQREEYRRRKESGKFPHSADPAVRAKRYQEKKKSHSSVEGIAS